MSFNRLRRFAPVLALAAMCVGLSACGPDKPPVVDGPAPFSPIDQIYTPEDTAKAGLQLRWRRLLGVHSGEMITKVWRVQDSIFAVTNDNKLFSIDATSGKRNWVYKFEDNTIRITRPQISARNRYVYVVTAGRIFVLDKETGDFLTQSPLRFSATCDPVVVNWENFSEICVGGADRFHGIFVDPLGGSRWNVPDFKQAFRSTPALTTADGLFVASTGGKLWRLSPINSGKASWQDRKVNGEVIAPLTADSSRVLVPCLDKRLYSFEAGQGTPQWDTYLEGILDQQAMITSQAILCVGTGKGVFGLKPDNGKILWNIPDIAVLGSRIENHVYALDTLGNLVSISTETGEVEAVCQGKAAAGIVRNDSDSLVFVFTADGRVNCFEQLK